MTDDLIIAIVLGTLGVAAVAHGGLDGFGQIAGAFGVAIVGRRIVRWWQRRREFPRAKAKLSGVSGSRPDGLEPLRSFTSRSEDRAPPPDSAAD